MKVLVVGPDGRAHALAWRLANSPSVDEVISAPGNPGTARVGKRFDVATMDLEGMADLAAAHDVDLTVVSPEDPIAAGIADVFTARGLRVFAPSKAAADIEASKVFCRDVAAKAGAPMAAGESFDDPDAAVDFASTMAPPIVVKAEGLAAGKGVVICEDHAAARRAIDAAMRDKAFGDSGDRVVIEECLVGRETSIFCVTDGESRLILEPAQDYKRALDGDAGLNTGGMGAYSPVPWLAVEERQRAIDEIVYPMLDELAERGRTFRGCFYAGLMFTDKGPRLIEVNCRFGDPETQVLLPRLRTDFGELLAACADGTLGPQELEWRDEAAVCVAVASGGYPEAYEKGVGISGIEEAEALGDVVVFQAGTAMDGDRLVSAGGRVLNVTALGSDVESARALAYRAVDAIDFPGSHHRTDIAKGV